MKNVAYRAGVREKRRLKDAYFSTCNLEQRRLTLLSFLNDPGVKAEALSVVGSTSFDNMPGSLSKNAVVRIHLVESIRDMNET